MLLKLNRGETEHIQMSSSQFVADFIATFTKGSGGTAPPISMVAELCAAISRSQDRGLAPPAPAPVLHVKPDLPVPEHSSDSTIQVKRDLSASEQKPNVERKKVSLELDEDALGTIGDGVVDSLSIEDATEREIMKRLVSTFVLTSLEASSSKLVRKMQRILESCDQAAEKLAETPL